MRSAAPCDRQPARQGSKLGKTCGCCKDWWNPGARAHQYQSHFSKILIIKSHCGLAIVRNNKNDVILTAPTASLTAFLQNNLADAIKKDADLTFIRLK
jgi:hypothetical protein